MKKLFITFIAVLSVILISFSNITAFADEVNISSEAAYLTDYGSGTEIYKKNETKRLPIASMTKIMLLNLCFEKAEEGVFGFEDEITVSKNASGMGGSQVFLEEGGKYRAEDLIKSIIVASANDASVAMAELLYGSETECVKAMNDKCKEWGMENTLFSNCTGLTKPTQYSCAKDVATMMGKLISHKDYFRFSNIWMDEIKHPKDRVTGISNTNKLIKYYEGCDGGKTGYTSESGHCIAATAKRGAMRLISVVIKGTDSKGRFADASALFNYGFDNYASKMAVDSSKPLNLKVSVGKGKKDEISVIPERDVFIFSKRNTKDDVKVDFNPFKCVAPVKSGEVIGELIVYKDNVQFDKVNVLSNEDVDRKAFFDYIKDIALDY